MKLVLASTSNYRKDLLERLQLPFEARSPGVDETPRPDEGAKALAARLAVAKAQAVSVPGAAELIIGSDQVAVLEGKLLGKPGSHRANKAQLMAAAGKTVTFETAVCVLNTANGSERTLVVPFAVRFLDLSEAQIDRYLRLEPAWDCAGGFKCEGLGASLFAAMEGEDPTALVGLPLIGLSALLREQGLDPLGNQP